MPTRGAVEKLGAAPLGVTVVELPASVASCVTVAGCAPSVEGPYMSVSQEFRTRWLFTQWHGHTEERGAARAGDLSLEVVWNEIAVLLSDEAKRSLAAVRARNVRRDIRERALECGVPERLQVRDGERASVLLDIIE